MSFLTQILMGVLDVGSDASAVISSIGNLLNQWYTQTPKIKAFSLKYLNGRIWAPSANGLLASSSDGIDWDVQNITTSLPNGIKFARISDITYGAGLYVAVGRNVIFTSSDSINWDLRALSPSIDATAIAWSPVLNRFLIGGSKGEFATSIDGISWSPLTSPVTTGITKIIWDNGRFSAISNEFVCTSTNGINFSSTSRGAGFIFTDITWSAPLSMYAATGYNINGAVPAVYTSSDGLTWTQRQIGNLFNNGLGQGRSVVWAGDRFVVTSDYGVASSSNGITWTGLHFTITNLLNLVWTGTSIVGVQVSSRLTSAAGNRFFVSADYGKSWSYNSLEIHQQTLAFNAGPVTYVNNRYFRFALHPEFGSGTPLIEFSYDKKNWYITSIPYALNGAAFTHVSYVANSATPFYIAAGKDNASFTTGYPRILVSTDGLSWSEGIQPNMGPIVTSIATNGTIAVVSANGIYSSTNGTLWTNRTTPANGLILSSPPPQRVGAALIWAAGKFVAVSGSTAWYSTDGISWARVNFNIPNLSLVSVAHDGTKFVAIGFGNSTVNVMVSIDGVLWAASSFAPWGTRPMLCVSSAGGNLIALPVNNYASEGLPKAYCSSDSGATWVSTDLPGMNHYPAISADGVAYISTSDSNFAYESVNGVNWKVVPRVEPNLSTNTHQLFTVDGKLGIPISKGGVGIYDPETGLWDNKYAGNYIKDSISTVKKFNSKYFVCYNAGVAAYDDLASWSIGGWQVSTYATTVKDIASNGQILVAACHNGEVLGATPMLLSSDGGLTWTAAGPGNMQSVEYANGMFVAAGYGLLPGSNNVSAGQIYTSTDGYNWTMRYSSTTDRYQSIAYGNGAWVVVNSGLVNLIDGATGNNLKKFFTSVDGLSWTGQGSLSYASMKLVVFGNSMFAAVGNSGKVHTSVDGVNWLAETITNDVFLSIVWTGTDYWANTVSGDLIRYIPDGI